MGQFWNKHKGQVFASITGALVGSLITLGAGVFNLSRSFKYQQNHEILNSTRLGIGFLQNIQTEMDANFNLMQNHDYKASIQLGDTFNQGDAFIQFLETGMNSPTNSATEKQQMKEFLGLIKKMYPTGRKIEQFNTPEEPLSTAVWDHGSPEIADIDYDLLRELTQYYLAVHRLNATLSGFTSTQMANVTPGGVVPPEFAEKLKAMVALHNDNVARLTERSVTDLKYRIQKEMQRLHDMRKKVEQSL